MNAIISVCVCVCYVASLGDTQHTQIEDNAINIIPMTIGGDHCAHITVRIIHRGIIIVSGSSTEWQSQHWGPSI